jgi:Reverse transcriptase (RNA-dependent DNA polymerase)
MRISWEKLSNHVGTLYGQDIATELTTGRRTLVPKPSHSLNVERRHVASEATRKARLERLRNALAKVAVGLEEKAAGGDVEAGVDLAVKLNEIEALEEQIAKDLPIVLEGDEKAEWEANWKIYRSKVEALQKHRGQAFSMIKGQCTQALLEQMKCDTDYTTIIASNDPLRLKTLIERAIISQSENKYPYATLYEQEVGLFGFQQNLMTDDQWHERFNTKVDIGNSLGVTREHLLSLNYVSEDLYSKKFEELDPDEKEEVREDAKERYLAYIFLRQSGTQHEQLKRDLSNDFTKAADAATRAKVYPKTRDEVYGYLQRYSKTVPRLPTPSEGGSFVQKGGKGGKEEKDEKDVYDKKYWKDKTCHQCGKKGHPKYACKKDADEDKSVSSKATKASAKSKKEALATVKEVNKYLKKQRKTFATLEARLEEEANSDITESDDEEAEQEQAHFQFAFHTRHIFHSMKLQDINMKDVILLDNESTTDLFCNKRFVTDIRKSKSTVTINGNGGTLKVTKKATLPGYHRKVWFDPKAITNILSLANVKKQYRVTYDSQEGKGDFIVHRSEHGMPDMHFCMHPTGLHVYHPTDDEIMLLNTVSGNLQGYTKRQVAGATLAKALYEKLAYPSIKDFEWAITSNQIKDCPVTTADIRTAQAIWGKDVRALKGKTVRSNAPRAQEMQLHVPKDFLKQHKDVYLCIDLFFVNKFPFFVTVSRRIDFTTANHLENRKISTIFKAFKDVYRYYLQRGFRIVEVHADSEFEALGTYLTEMPRGPRLNIATADEHVPEVERRIRVIKERTRAIIHGLPYPRLPKIMIIHMVLNVVKLLTYFPTKGGISPYWSPRMLMAGKPLDFKKDLALEFGAYCQVHAHDTPRNSMKPRTIGAICLGPTGNDQGGYKFMNLATGLKITAFKWEALPVTAQVIKRVTALGKTQPKLLTFYDRSGHALEDADVQIAGVDGDEEESAEENDDILEELQEIAEQDAEQQIIDEEEAPPIQLQRIAEEQPVGQVQQPVIEPQENAQADEVPPPTVETTGVRRSTRLRTQPSSYVPSMTGKRYVTAVTLLESGKMIPEQHFKFFNYMQKKTPDVVAMIMTQLSLKAGLKAWGKKAEKAVYTEMKQLHIRNTFRPRRWKDLTKEQKDKLLESHLFLKKKRCGAIKGRTVAGGNKQRSYTTKDEVSSPTVSTNALMLSCIVDAHEERDVMTIDIPNAFIQTKVENPTDRALIKIKGLLVDVLLEIAPEVYGKYVHTDKKGNKVLIAECMNAIYGTMIAGLLYYVKFCGTLKRLDFEPNPYEPCVYNKEVNGKQQTILFHVDDCKASHVDAKVNDELEANLRAEYEQIMEDGSGAMKVHRGHKHEYLGMTLDYSKKGVCQITMPKFLTEALAEYKRAMPISVGTKPTAGPKDLFIVDQECPKLGDRRKRLFHSLVAKLLFATKRARPDTATVISFLMTRTQDPDTDDWGKLEHLMKYIKGTKDLPLTLGMKGPNVLKWWIDGSHAVHPNMRGHTGGGLSLGRGFPISQSSKQKLNTRSSTESELVAVDDMMPTILWTRQFMECQGYPVKENLIYQDNQAAMLLEKNGKASSGKRTRHINTRFFFVTDRISAKEVSVGWCPTEDMTGDFWTKPLQGAEFRRMRDLIMGVVPQKEPRKSKAKRRQEPPKSKLKRCEPKVRRGRRDDVPAAGVRWRSSTGATGAPT